LLLGQGALSYAQAITAFNEQTEDWEARDRWSVPVLKVLYKHSLNRLKQCTKTLSTDRDSRSVPFKRKAKFLNTVSLLNNFFKRLSYQISWKSDKRFSRC